MSNFRDRPKGDYIQQATWQDLYKLTERWKNNIEYNEKVTIFTI